MQQRRGLPMGRKPRLKPANCLRIMRLELGYTTTAEFAQAAHIGDATGANVRHFELGSRSLSYTNARKYLQFAKRRKYPLTWEDIKKLPHYAPPDGG